MSIGGIEMILGYFLYQVFILRYGVYAAATEIPINLGQCIAGVIIGLSILSLIRKASLKRSYHRRY